MLVCPGVDLVYFLYMTIIQSVSDQMDKALVFFSEDIATIRTGRATPALLENITVGVYGGKRMRLQELGTILASDARTLTFQPWDSTILKEVKNGILAANLGFNPVDDGQIIRITLPALTGEQREEYVKLLGRKLEGAKEVIRRIRGDQRHLLQDQLKAKTISEDVFRKSEEDLQKVTDEKTKRLEEMAKLKEGDIRGE